MISVFDVIQLLNLQPHPIEGGFFCETYRCVDMTQNRNLSTSIYYMLSGSAVSEMHLLPGDEIYHYYLGDPLEMLQLHPDGREELHAIGADLLLGQRPQVIVPGGVWQGSRRVGNNFGFTLIGATMAPGFDYGDYTRGEREKLTQRWGDHADLIKLLTPNG
jgi:uncharacterized protein